MATTAYLRVFYRHPRSAILLQKQVSKATANRRRQEEHPASLPRGNCKVATLPAQSLFQVRGNAGQSLGPLPAAFIILLAGRARSNVIWFTLVLVDWPESLCLQRRPMVPTKSSSSAQAYQARRFWYGWDWIGCSGPTSRSHQHRIRLLDLLVSTSDWSSQRIPS